MTDAPAIAAINREQLATATDRLLLRSSRPTLRTAHNRRRAASSWPGVAAQLGGSPTGLVLRATVTHMSATYSAGSYAEQRSADELPRTRARGGVARALLALGVTIPTVVGIGFAVAAFC